MVWEKKNGSSGCGTTDDVDVKDNAPCLLITQPVGDEYSRAYPTGSSDCIIIEEVPAATV